MSDIKYEPVFGDQSLFEGVSDDTVMVIRQPGDNMPWCFESFDEGFEYVSQGDRNPEVAMRRIIKTPVWTWKDKEVGKLPPIGALCIGVESGQQYEVICITSKNIVTRCFSTDRCYVYIITEFIRWHDPIETPEEKAKRLRDEWVESVMNLTPCADASMFLITVQENQTKHIYDALLSGELTVPSR